MGDATGGRSYDIVYGITHWFASNGWLCGEVLYFSALIKGGESFYWLAIAGGINSVISLYYYLRVVKVMYFEGERKDFIVNPSGVITGMLLATSIPSLLLGIYWLPVANWIQNSLVFFIQTI